MQGNRLQTQGDKLVMNPSRLLEAIEKAGAGYTTASSIHEAQPH
ncbi:MAG: hypothetical protein ACMUEM_01615 [Flavobacteriales bacterium AspAUS03]